MRCLRLKAGVKLANLQPQAVLAITVAWTLWQTFFDHDMWITSVHEGVHRPGSLHYVGLAFDMRTRTITTSDAKKYAARLRRLLSKEFDVVVQKDHIHVEWQPKV